MPLRAGHRRRVITRLPGAGQMPRAGSGAARPLLVRAVSQLVPATGSGRDARPGPAPDDRPAPAAVAPGHRRPEGRDPPGRPARPRPGHRMWAWDGRPSPALSRPWPGRAVAPGAGGPLRGTGRGPVAIVRGWPVRAGPVRRRLMSDRAVTGASPFGARFPRLPRGPGSDGPPRAPPELPTWPGGSGALSAQFPPAGSR